MSPVAISRTHKMILVALFAALIAVGAFIRIPVPFVPFTMQTFFIVLSGMLLGKKLGAASAALYVLIGLVGIPVFTQGGGIGYVLKPSFGYLIGFVAGAYITGAITRRKPSPSFAWLLFAAGVGLVAVYVFGTAYFYLLSNYYLGQQVSVWSSVLYCFLVFVPGDLIKSIIAALLARRMIPALQKSNLA